MLKINRPTGVTVETEHFVFEQKRHTADGHLFWDFTRKEHRSLDGFYALGELLDSIVESSNTSQ